MNCNQNCNQGRNCTCEQELTTGDKWALALMSVAGVGVLVVWFMGV